MLKLSRSYSGLLLVAASVVSTVVLASTLPPPVNPFFADSNVPIGHGNAAQTDSINVAGPEGPTEIIEAATGDVTYQHMGPGHFGIAISPEYPNGKRAIWSNGGDRISKLDYDTLDVISEYALKPTLQTAAEADADIALLDSLSGADLALASIPLAVEYLTGLAGVYYLLDAENTLFVGGTDSVVAYGDVDANPADQNSAITKTGEWFKPVGIGGTFAGANLMFDGRICMVTNEGWIVVLERDFSSYEAIQLPGAGIAAAHNQMMIDNGLRPGAADWVRNAPAVDENGGIYVPSFETMHKVVWDGTNLSVAEADGAWHAPYSNTDGRGSGATPSLLGFGPGEDHLVVITDGDTVMNVEAFWRDSVPAGWVPPVDALSDRTAGKIRVDMGDPGITAIQTQQSVVVGGNGIAVVNNEPASIPDGFPAAAKTILVGFAGNDELFKPRGIQKFEWNMVDNTLTEAWVAESVSSINAVPIVSLASDIFYTVGARGGSWSVEANDWITGESKFTYFTGSARYNTLYSGMNLDQEGRIIHTTAFGVSRYERLPGIHTGPGC
ncbi:MAG: hypothetical protein Hals2KO_39420 [Halioglobus sp.]